MAEGRIPPMILVAVSQNPVPHQDSECVDAVGGAKADTYLTQDAPDAITQHLRVITDRTAWSLIGYSTGGDRAVDPAPRHPPPFPPPGSPDPRFPPPTDAPAREPLHTNPPAPRPPTP